MMAGSFSSALKLFLATTFVWIQAYSLAHAAEHGEEHHEHEGVECELTVFASEDQAILPDPPSSPAPAHFLLVLPTDIALISAHSRPLDRGQSARGPPASSF